MKMKGVLYLKNPAGELFEEIVEFPSDGKPHQKQLFRSECKSKTKLQVNLTSDFPDQFKCSVGEGQNRVLFEFNLKCLSSEEISSVITGRNLWTGRYTKWVASFEKL